MKILLAAVGRMRRTPEAELVKRYLERTAKAGPGIGLGAIDLREFDEARDPDVGRRKMREAERLLGAAATCSVRVILDERGRQLDSAAFAKHLCSWRDNGSGAVAFLLGGADGHDTTLRHQADIVFSLGPMTLPHLLARVVLCEQIYRAVTILAKHPYHRT